MISARTHRHVRLLLAAELSVAALVLPGCGPESEHDHGQDRHAEQTGAAEESSHIGIPENVRRNLGITFVKVERRPVQSTVRLPGQFELRPEARREYHVMLPGRIQLLVKQYQAVEEGQSLFVLDSPEWQKMQSELVAARNMMRRSHADVAVVEATLTEMEKGVEFLEQRLTHLAEAQVRQVELEADLAEKRNTLPRLEAEVEAARTEFSAAHSRYEVMLGSAASFTGVAVADLDPHAGEHGHLDEGEPPWRAIRKVTVRAEAAGVINRLAVTNQGWVETGELVLDSVDPTALRFHADALQTDINLFRDGQAGRIVPPQGGSIDLQDTVDGQITVGFEAHPEERVVPIFLEPESLPRWAKPGVTAFLEVFTVAEGEQVLAVPEACVVRDGLERVFFRRDPDDVDQVIRIAADLGVSDGQWVEVRQGVESGDEIVLGGVYPLMLASSGSGDIEPGGHFHSDGSFHQGEEK